MKRFKARQIYLLFIFILSGFLITGCGGGEAETGHWLPPPSQLASIEVTPATASIPMGAPQQFMATATYTDGSSSDVTASSIWTSGTTGVATVNSASGLAAGIAIGTSVITADFGGKSGSATLTVTAATLSSIVVTPLTASIPMGLTQRFVATGAYSDGTSVDISNLVTWSSGTLAVATVVSPGVATGKSVGVATITATSGGKSGSATLTVTAATLSSITVAPLTASIPMGFTQRFVATGAYSDGTSVDISNLVTWSSGALAVATVVSPGVATGKSVGTATITATSGGKSGSATLIVTAATLSSITVAPLAATVQIGGTQTFVATGHFSDGTYVNISNLVTWSSGTLAVATVVSPGVATGLSGGTATITATYGAKSGSATLTVVPAAGVTLISIAVTPPTPSVAIGGTQAFVARGTYSDSSVVDISNLVTWTSGTLPVATVVSPGVATGQSAGTATITATSGARAGSATLTVTAVPPPASCAGPGPLYLASATNFGVLAGAALSLTNPTSVTGNVGSPSITPASGPSTLVGTKYDTASGSLTLIANAVSDMQTAVGCANGRTCDVNFPAAIDLGLIGSPLGPGVYCAGGAINITGILSLNAPGVYIFLTPGTLTTAANAVVQFTGTATAANASVFWVPGGATTIAADSTFIGTVMTSSAAITVGANSTLAPGRALSGSAVTLNTNTIARP